MGISVVMKKNLYCETGKDSKYANITFLHWGGKYVENQTSCNCFCYLIWGGSIIYISGKWISKTGSFHFEKGRKKTDVKPLPVGLHGQSRDYNLKSFQRPDKSRKLGSLVDSGTEQQPGLATGAAVSPRGLLAGVFDPGALVAQSPPPATLFFWENPETRVLVKFIFYLNFRKKIKLSTPSNKFLCWANTADLPSSEINEARGRLGGSFSEHWSLGPIEQGWGGGGSSALLNQVIFPYFCGKGSAQREGHLGK